MANAGITGVGNAVKAFFQILLFLVLLVGSFYAGHYLYPKKVTVELPGRVDTVTVIDTIKVNIPVPDIRYIARVDTVYMKQVDRDTVEVLVEVPIERKVYETELYRAEIEGFRPNLVSMSIYQPTKIVTEYKTITEKISNRWGVGVQVGYGVGLHNGSIRTVPYVGVGVSYNLFTW